MIGRRGAEYSPALHLLLLLVWMALLVVFAGVGHISADDQMYIAAAREWLATGSLLPESHWTVRHTVILPIALSFALFGDGEWQSVLPSTLYALGLAWTLYAVMRRYHGATAALVGTAIFVTTGLFAELGTIIHPDATESLFLLLGLFLFYEGAVVHGGDNKRLFGAGVLLGLAFVTRETAAAVPLALGVLFLLGAYTQRWHYFVLGIGFLLPVLIEAGYYMSLGEGPLYRYETVLGSTKAGPTLEMGGEVHAGTGNVTDNRLIGPFAALLLNNEFMLVFWGAIAAGIALLRAGTLRRAEEYGFTRLLLIVTAVWVFVEFYAFGLRPLPRYLLIPLITGTFLIGPWLAGLMATPGRRPVALIVLALILAANLFAIDLSNKAPRKPERLLAEWALSHQEPIYASDEFISRAQNFLRWDGVGADKVLAGPPPPGALYAVRLVTRGTGGVQAEASLEPDLHDAEVVDGWDGDRTVTGTVIGLFGLEGVVRGTPLARLLRYGEPVRLYRLPNE